MPTARGMNFLLSTQYPLQPKWFLHHKGTSIAPPNIPANLDNMDSLDAEIRHARYIMSRLLLDCLRLVDKVRLQSGQLTNDETIIGMAVIVLEYEKGVPSTSISKLSFFTGVPRATVGRIVDRLVDMGLVRRVGHTVAYAHPVDEAALRAARKFWVLMDEAAQQLALLKKI